MAQDNQPILDYAKPATPVGGINYRFDVEEFDHGVRFTERGNVRSYRAAGALMACIAIVCIAAAVYPMFNWTDYDRDRIRFSIIMCSVALLLGIGAWQHMNWSHRPIVLEVRSDKIVLRDPRQLLWGKKKTWVVSRIRSIRIYKATLVLKSGRPSGEMSLSKGFFTAPVLANIEFRELEEIAERMHCITGLEVKRPGLFSIV